MTAPSPRSLALVALLSAAMYAGPADASAVDDSLMQAVNAIAEGDFDQARELLTGAEAGAPDETSILPGFTLAGIYYYQGVMEFFAGDKEQAALDFWRKALEKDLFFNWDTTLVADREAQALFEALRSEVDSRTLLTIEAPTDEGLRLYLDGQAVKPRLEIVIGTHLAQVECPDESTHGAWVVLGDEVPDFRSLCPGVERAPAPVEEEPDKKKKKDK